MGHAAILLRSCVTQVTESRRENAYVSGMDRLMRIWPTSARIATLSLFVALSAVFSVSAQPAAIPEAVVVQRTIDRFTAVEGVVEAERQSTLAAQVAGRVVARPVKAGDAVKAGQLLVQIDPRSATQAEAASQSQVHEAQANLGNAKAKFARSEELAKRKFISQAALDQARAEYLAAQAQASAALANAGASATSRSFTTIIAPYDGVVASTGVEIGDMATPGRPLVVVFDPRALRVTATLPQAVLARADLAAPVQIALPSLGLTLAPRRLTVIPIADVHTHTTQIRLDLPETTGVMPGQYARASIVIGHASALTIPQSAVLRRSEVTAVYVLDATGKAQLRQVRLGEPVGNDEIEVLAGLNPGERVAREPVRAGIEASSRDSPRW
jgi:membrane fusion protein, multidrug efflux system